MTQLWCTLDKVFLVQLYFKKPSAGKSRRFFCQLKGLVFRKLRNEWATKFLKLRPCKASVFYALKEHDPVSRIHFCIWFLLSVNDGGFGPHLVCFSREVWFLLRGEVNSQNSWYWSAENPGIIHEHTLS